MRGTFALALGLTIMLAGSALADAGPGGLPTLDVIPVAAFDSVLTRYVHDGTVDYGGLAADTGALDAYLKRTETAEPGRFTREAQIAFWVNTYNARILEGVIKRPGLESVLDPGKILGIPTLAFFREKRLSAGDMLSLDDIEHRILRAQYREPRIHFVLSCASTSCPPLPERALSAATLDSVMDAATRGFLADTDRNRLGRDGRLELSSIFKWFKKDFVAASGSVQAFVRDYWPDREIELGDRRIRHLPYDWSLNGHW